MSEKQKNKRDKAREYKPSSVRRLDTLSGNQCSSPDCNNSLIARDEISIISKICHIEAASEFGPRYNPNMTDDERRAYDNLILLCDECHTIIDNIENEKAYPVNRLKEWKLNHEKKILSGKNAYIELKQHPSSIATVINCIGASVFFSDEDNQENTSFSPDKKITHNNIIDYKPIIEEYKEYQGKIQKLYFEIEEQGSLKKSILLQNIKTIYIKAKRKYVDNEETELNAIRQNADEIFDDVKNELWEIIENSNNLNENTSYEAINIGLLIVMVDAFIACKILEEPPK